MKQITVTEKEENQRLDKFLLKYFNRAPKSFIYKMLRKKRIKYKGAKGSGSEILQKGDTIQMFLAEDTVSELRNLNKLEAVKTDFKTLYEDANILVVNKSAGCLSQKESANTKNSLIEQALFYLWERDEYNPQNENLFTPALCNRLDRNTSGIVIIGKSVKALQEISNALQNGNISKYYITLVKGNVKHGEKLKAFLTKDSETNTVTVTEEQTPFSKPILTVFEPIRTNTKYSLLEVSLKTGRPHQIRAHLSYAGFPVIGDKKYGHKGVNMTFLRKYGLNHQFLHSYKITFANIEGDFSYLNGKEISCGLPENLENIVDNIFGGC